MICNDTINQICIIIINLKICAKDLNELIRIRDEDQFTIKTYNQLNDSNDTVTLVQPCKYFSNTIDIKIVILS
ncbi:MAG: hypothetical protein IJU54_02615 [Alphaproteobacteria bacterium]|nr:hypothetical protein [Alphaproteobacteria bacterium]